MRIAIIGYGRMGMEIEMMALSRNHTVDLIIDKDNTGDLNRENLKGIDVAIEFTLPEKAFYNISTCLKYGVSVVSGTTGWLDQFNEAVELCESSNSAFIYASNYSIGVNILFHMNRHLSEVMNRYKQYKVDLSEVHHFNKIDSPSGTAIKLAGEIIANHESYNKWRPSEETGEGDIPIHSTRKGKVTGIHTLKWLSDEDCLTLSHEAFGRKGYALGAVVAAEYILGKRGFITMSDMLGF